MSVGETELSETPTSHLDGVRGVRLFCENSWSSEYVSYMSQSPKVIFGLVCWPVESSVTARSEGPGKDLPRWAIVGGPLLGGPEPEGNLIDDCGCMCGDAWGEEPPLLGLKEDVLSCSCCLCHSAKRAGRSCLNLQLESGQVPLLKALKHTKSLLDPGGSAWRVLLI